MLGNGLRASDCLSQDKSDIFFGVRLVETHSETSIEAPSTALVAALVENRALEHFEVTDGIACNISKN